MGHFALAEQSQSWFLKNLMKRCDYGFHTNFRCVYELYNNNLRPGPQQLIFLVSCGWFSFESLFGQSWTKPGLELNENWTNTKLKLSQNWSISGLNLEQNYIKTGLKLNQNWIKSTLKMEPKLEKKLCQNLCKFLLKLD